MAELRVTRASTGAGYRTVGLEDSENLVTSDNCEELARACVHFGHVERTLDLGDTVRITEDLTNPALPSVCHSCVYLAVVLTGREWRPSSRAWRSARRPARGWS